MKRLTALLARKKTTHAHKGYVDEKTLFYIFGDVIRAEFGEQGMRRFTPAHFTGRTLIVVAKDHLWGNELWINRARIAEKVNARIGQKTVVALKVVYEGGRARS